MFKLLVSLCFSLCSLSAIGMNNLKEAKDQENATSIINKVDLADLYIFSPFDDETSYQISYRDKNNYGYGTDLMIPSAYKGKTVTRISDFQDCTSLTSIAFDGIKEQWSNIVKYPNR